jgi:hemolysin III
LARIVRLKDTHYNEPLCSLTHFVGALLSVAALTLLVIFASLDRTPRHVIGFSIFGASFVALYLASTFYHIAPKPSKTRDILKRIDHSMVYVVIAATYTPVCLILHARPWALPLLGVVWLLAVAGIVLKVIGIGIDDWRLTLTLYAGLNWPGVVAFPAFARSLPHGGMLWLIGGGALYASGAVFYGLNHFVPRTRWFGMHEVFHVFVLAGNFSHFWLMLKYVLYV